MNKEEKKSWLTAGVIGSVILTAAGGYFVRSDKFGDFPLKQTYKDCSGVVYRQQIYPVTSGVIKKFIMFENGEVIDDFARNPNTDKKGAAGGFALNGKLMAAEKGDTIWYRKWSGGKTEVTDVRFATNAD